MAFHVWKKALGCTTFQPHWKAFFNPKAPLLAQKNDALRLTLEARRHVSISNLILNFAPVTLSGETTLNIGCRPYAKDRLNDLAR